MAPILGRFLLFWGKGTCLLAWVFLGVYFSIFPTFLKAEEGMGLHIVKKKKKRGCFDDQDV